MSKVLDLLRPDLREFSGYASARRTKVTGTVWLNANESPWPSVIDGGQSLHRYPEPQPTALRERMAQLYQVRTEQLLVTRGSDEGIDLLVRAFCRAGRDAVLIASPCFGMYAVAARVQNAPLVDVPLLEACGTWSLDMSRLLATIAEKNVRVVFLCSPANPTGQALALGQIRELAETLAGRALLVIDEAYAEFSAVPSAAGLLDEFSGVVVLRTLSKAHALAGARIGAVLADAELIAMLRNLAAPYPVPVPSAALALAALSDDVIEESTQRCRAAIAERQILRKSLATVAGVRRVYASEGNFLLVRFDDAQLAYERLLGAGVVVRDMRAMPRLRDALRITVGNAEDNRALLTALRQEALA